MLIHDFETIMVFCDMEHGKCILRLLLRSQHINSNFSVTLCFCWVEYADYFMLMYICITVTCIPRITSIDDTSLMTLAEWSH